MVSKKKVRRKKGMKFPKYILFLIILIALAVLTYTYSPKVLLGPACDGIPDTWDHPGWGSGIGSKCTLKGTWVYETASVREEYDGKCLGGLGSLGNPPRKCRSGLSTSYYITKSNDGFGPVERDESKGGEGKYGRGVIEEGKYKPKCKSSGYCSVNEISLRNGRWKTYYENGNIEWDRKYQAISGKTEDQLNGKSKMYHEDGTLLRENSYWNNLLSQTYKEYYEDSGNIKIKTKYKVVGIDNPGTPPRIVSHQNGKYTRYFEDGDVEERGSNRACDDDYPQCYKEGVRTGKWEKWAKLRDGTTMKIYEGQFSPIGQRIGVHTYTGFRILGRNDGDYPHKGDLQHETLENAGGTSSDGTRDYGTINTIKDEYATLDTLTTRIMLDIDDRLIAIIPYSDNKKNGRMKVWDHRIIIDDGGYQIEPGWRTEIDYIDGYKDGEEILVWYDDDGNEFMSEKKNWVVVEETEYIKKSYLDGAYEGYYPEDGGLAVTGSYTLDQQTGLWENYDDTTGVVYLARNFYSFPGSPIYGCLTSRTEYNVETGEPLCTWFASTTAACQTIPGGSGEPICDPGWCPSLGDPVGGSSCSLT